MRARYLYFLIFLVPLIVNPYAFEVFFISKMSWLFVIVGSALLVSAIALLQKKKIQLQYTPLFVGWAAITGLSFLLSSIFSSAPTQSFWGLYQSMTGMLTALLIGAHLFLFAQLFRTKKTWRHTIQLTIGIGVAVSVYGILQKFGIDIIIHAPDEQFVGRAYSTFGQPNMMGQFLLIPLIAALIWIRKHPAIYGVCAAILGTGLFLTENRASLIALGLVGGLFLLKKLKLSPKKLGGILIVGAILLGIAGTIIAPSIRSWNTRRILWSQSLPLASENPIIGAGPNTFYSEFQKVLPNELYAFEGMYSTPHRVHSEFISILLDRGLLGLVTYIMMLALLVRAYLRKKERTPLEQIVLYTLIAFTLSMQASFSAPDHLPIIGALWMMLVMMELPQKTYVFPPKLAMRGGSVILLAAIGIGSSIHGANITRTDIRFKEALSAYIYEPEKSLQLFREAHDLSPQYAYISNTFLALFTPFAKESLGTYKNIGHHLSNLEKITNKDFKYYMYRAELAHVEGKYLERNDYYEAATRLAPNHPAIYEEWGLAAFKQKDYVVAQDKLERLRLMAPKYWIFRRGTPEYNEQANYTFRKSNQRFMNAMRTLVQVYKAQGLEKEAAELQQYL